MGQIAGTIALSTAASGRFLSGVGAGRRAIEETPCERIRGVKNEHAHSLPSAISSFDRDITQSQILCRFPKARPARGKMIDAPARRVR